VNLSLRNRVATSFIIANIVVLVMSFTVFHFLNSLNKNIEKITAKSNRISLLTDEIRISAVSILKYQRRLLTGKPTEILVRKVLDLSEILTSQLQTLDSLYNHNDGKKVVAQMLSYVDSLQLVLGKATIFSKGRAAPSDTESSKHGAVGIASIGELADKILEAFSEFQDIQYFQSVERDKRIKKIINETKKNMMITLIIGFLGTIILGLVVPGKIALPFKKIKDAIRELQECNFDVSIYYNQDDEIGEIAREMNKMIHSFKIFDELRSDRISLENRKFDALANLIHRPVLVASAGAKLIYMNNQLYSLLQVNSEDVIGKAMTESVIPKNIIEAYELAIKRRSKLENQTIKIYGKKIETLDDQDIISVDEFSEDTQNAVKELEKLVESNEEDNIIFEGYANIIPIRGKESSLDYYLMVLSTRVFT